ncbi:MAG TPA: hypothetical protein V6D22_24120 [Candidatus Obscuribacterales bacterium]
MIDCPICHVKNHDDARFCAECGQRLSAPGQPANPTPSEPPMQAHAQDAQRPPQSRLHSPLLSSGDAGADAPSASPTDPGDVNRLRQMSTRAPNKDDHQVKPQETPYKNPFDPRNAAAQTGDTSAKPGEQQRPKLRSPLLSSEEFDDNDPAFADPPAANPPQRGRGLHSPLLGGEPAAHLRSPLLGGGSASQYQEDDDQAVSGGGLRSPLLGGGHHAPDRRGTASESYEGQERRRGPLHSPLLGNTQTDSYHFDEAEEEDEPLDEDNPNVLRSPLLAAKRPLSDRDRPAVKSPSGSNTQTPLRPPQSPQAMQFGAQRGSPNSSYNSLQSISSNTGGQAPAAPPPAPSQPSSSGPPPASVPPASTQPPVAPAPAQVASLFGDQPPSSVPPAFQNMQASASQMAAQAQPRPNSAAAPVGRTDGTTGGINVQPPARKSPELTSTPSTPLPQSSYATPSQEPMRKAPSRLLAEDDNDQAYDYNSRGAQDRYPERKGSPIAKIIGIVAVLMLLSKCWVLYSFCQTDWVKSPFLVVDQLLGMALIFCVIGLAFGRDR